MKAEHLTDDEVVGILEIRPDQIPSHDKEPPCWCGMRETPFFNDAEPDHRPVQHVRGCKGRGLFDLDGTPCGCVSIVSDSVGGWRVRPDEGLLLDENAPHEAIVHKVDGIGGATRCGAGSGVISGYWARVTCEECRRSPVGRGAVRP